MYRNSAILIDCFHKWRELKTEFYKEDTKLFRSITLISGIIFTSAILENLVSHWKYFKVVFYPKRSSENETPYSSVWEHYYMEAHGQYLRIIPYNIVVSILLFLCNKWAVYAWNFGDILISVIARAVYKRFQLHLEDLQEKLDGNIILAHGKEFIWWISERYSVTPLMFHENLCAHFNVQTNKPGSKLWKIMKT